MSANFVTPIGQYWMPPVTRTEPSFSNVAVCPVREIDISPAYVKVGLAGSKTSADELVEVEHQPSPPPVSKTVPSLSSVAVCMSRPLVIWPSNVNVDVAGSNNSARGM